MTWYEKFDQYGYDILKIAVCVKKKKTKSEVALS